MPALTVDQLQHMMKKRDNIRYIGVIAEESHGKATLASSLISQAGITIENLTDEAQASQERGQERGDSGVSLYAQHDGEPYLINLVNISLSSPEVTSSLRSIDGAIVLVDCNKGCGKQTECNLRRALFEHVKLCLFISKVDSCMQMEAEAVYQRCVAASDGVNKIVAMFNDVLTPMDMRVHPKDGTVVFGSALHGWSFTIWQFAKIYAAKLGLNEEKLLNRMWGDCFWHARKKAWTNVPEPEGCTEPLQRVFCEFIILPIKHLTQAIGDNNMEQGKKMMTYFGIVLTEHDEELSGDVLLTRTMQVWLNSMDSLLCMVVTKLPSPQAAEKYRVQNFGEESISICGPGCPLMVRVSDTGSSYAW